MDKLLVKLLDNVITKIKTSAKREGTNLPSSDSPVNAIQLVIKVTCQNNCFSLNIHSNIWKVFNGHHLHGKWQEIREKSKCLQMNRCWIPSPAGCWTSLPSLGSLLIPVWFTAPRRETLSAGAGVVMGRGVLSELLHRHLLHAVMSLWDTHAPLSLHSPRHWLLTALNCSKECCGVGFQTSGYLRQTSQDWFPLWL